MNGVHVAVRRPEWADDTKEGRWRPSLVFWGHDGHVPVCRYGPKRRVLVCDEGASGRTGSHPREILIDVLFG